MGGGAKNACYPGNHQGTRVSNATPTDIKEQGLETQDVKHYLDPTISRAPPATWVVVVVVVVGGQW